MTTGAVSIAARVAGCAVALWIGWRVFGAAGLVYAAPLLGVTFAKPLIELASSVRHAMRRARWRDVQGRHYAFRGRPMRVIADADAYRWVRLADVRAVVGFTASDGALQIAYPTGWRRTGRTAEPFLGEDALLEHLGKERGPDALRLRLWVEREVVFPARRERERLGIRRAPTGADRSG